jgi:hypothetical protein
MNAQQLLGLSMSPMLKRFRTWRLKRAILAVNSDIVLYERQITSAQLGIHAAKKRLLYLHNQLD